MPSHDERRLPGDPPGRPEGAHGHGSIADVQAIANLAIRFAEAMETIRALVIELDGAAGVELSRRALQLEKELGVHELIVSDSRRFLRELAKSELP